MLGVLSSNAFFLKTVLVYLLEMVLIRYDNLALSPLLLQRGLRIGPIQRNGAN